MQHILKAAPSHLSKGIILMLGAMFIFVSVNALFKTLDHTYPAIQIVFFRFFFATLSTGILAHLLKESLNLKGLSIAPHFFRGLVGATSLCLLFQSLLLLPLSDAVTISFASSFFVVIFSAYLLKEYGNWITWGAVLVGFLGILIVAKPTGINISPIGALTGLGSALLEGFLLVHSRSLSKTYSQSQITVYFSLFASLFSLLILPFFWVRPSLYDFIAMTLIGLGGGIGQYLLFTAAKYAPGNTLAPLFYTQILWSVGYSVFLFDEIPTKSLYGGCGLIIAAGVVVIFKDKIILIKQTD